MKLVVLKNNVPIDSVQVDIPEVFDGYEIFVGRAEDCHVFIQDPLISRHHFVLKSDGEGWFCEKLSQLGAVTVNGIAADHVKVVNGSEIKFGTYAVLISEMPEKKIIATKMSFPGPTSPVTSVHEAAVTPIELEVPVVSNERPVSLDDLSSTQEAEELPVPVEQDSNDSYAELSNFGTDENEVASSSAEEESFGEASESNDFSSIDEQLGSDDQISEQTEEEEKTSFFKTFVNYQLVLFGEHAPYDRYLIDKDEVFIGRDEKKCQIVLNDPEVSTVHAVLRKTKVDVTLEDLNSSNGTILNGERINRAHLVAGDEFVIGSTSFSLEAKSDLLDAEADRLMPVESGQVIEKEEIQEEEVSLDDNTQIDFDSNEQTEKSIIKRIWKNPEQRKKLIYALVVGVAAYVFLVPDEPAQTSAPDSSKEVATKKIEEKTPAKPKLQLSKEMEQRRNVAYELGVSFFEQSKYFEALKEFQTVIEIDPDYKKAQTYFEQTKAGLKRLEEFEVQKRAEEERIKLKKMIEELLVKARDAVKEKKVQLAESYFSQITEKDPENIEVQQLKIELEEWQKEQTRIAIDKAMKESARKQMVDALSPGKTFYLKKEWYRSILKLEDFLRRKGVDEDLVKEASDMLSDAKNQLASDLGPLLGKARSLKEGQDLRNAYEAFLEVLKVEPTNPEALNEVDEIRSQLEARSKKIFREAIIAESLSLFDDAKSKFQEVQQVSPTDSEYYKKATEKLKDYLE